MPRTPGLRIEGTRTTASNGQCKLGNGRFVLANPVVHYTAAALTDVGRKRASNEDAFGFSVEHGAYVVCDGMGGAAAGEIASSLAVGEVLRLLESRNEKADGVELRCRR